MNLNLLKDLKKDIKSNFTVENFMKELNNFLSTLNSSKAQNNHMDISNEREQVLQENRKEGHLYLVTEDRNNEIYLWDFTEQSKHEFKETIVSDELLKVAKEGAMLQYKNGTYELYSPYGYDMVFENKT